MSCSNSIGIGVSLGVFNKDGISLPKPLRQFSVLQFLKIGFLIQGGSCLVSLYKNFDDYYKERLTKKEAVLNFALETAISTFSSASGLNLIGLACSLDRRASSLRFGGIFLAGLILPSVGTYFFNYAKSNYLPHS